MSKLAKTQALATTSTEDNESLIGYAFLLLVVFSLMTFLFSSVINPWLLKVL